MESHVSQRVVQNLALVEHIVTRLASRFPSHIERDDLVQSGMVGLVEAAARFDPDNGSAFSTFAGRRIEGSIIDFVRKSDWLPRSARTRAKALSSTEDDLLCSTGDLPNDAELAKAAGLTPHQVRQIRLDVQRGMIQSLDSTGSSNDGVATLGDSIADSSAVDALEELEERELRSYIRASIHLLPERHRLVITAYYLDGRSMDEIASLLGVTQSRISQIKDESLTRMRAGVTSQFTAEKPATNSRRRQRTQTAYSAAIGSLESPLERIMARTSGEVL